MESRHERLYREALAAIQALFHDRSVPAHEVKSSLGGLADEISDLAVSLPDQEQEDED